MEKIADINVALGVGDGGVGGDGERKEREGVLRHGGLTVLPDLSSPGKIDLSLSISSRLGGVESLHFCWHLLTRHFPLTPLNPPRTLGVVARQLLAGWT